MSIQLQRSSLTDAWFDYLGTISLTEKSYLGELV